MGFYEKRKESKLLSLRIFLIMNKDILLKVVEEKLQQKINQLEKMIADLRASNSDTKSSMGDKYETGREMLQQEINNLQVQLSENMKAMENLKNITVHTSEKIMKGSVVKTNKGLFLIAISLGEINFNDEKIFIISPESPLAKMFLGKQKGDSFVLNGSPQNILEVF